MKTEHFYLKEKDEYKRFEVLREMFKSDGVIHFLMTADIDIYIDTVKGWQSQEGKMIKIDGIKNYQIVLLVRENWVSDVITKEREIKNGI